MKRAKVNAKIKTEPSFTNHKIPENLDRIFLGRGRGNDVMPPHALPNPKMSLFEDQV